MTEIEEKFFEVFGIEPKLVIKKEDWQKYKDKPNADKLYKQYPQITSDILLKLICILVQWDRDYEYLITSKFIEDLKQEILNDCIQSAKQFDEYYVEQVKSLFTEVGK